MGDSLQYIDIILLAMVAGFVALRLRSVLGRRTGDEESRAEKRSAPAMDNAGTANDDLQPRGADEAAIETPVWTRNIDRQSDLGRTLSRIMVADRHFNPDEFVEGARAAYGMIVESFAAGDRDRLKGLLSPDIFEDFESAISEREKAGQTMETTLVDIEDSRITDASLDGNAAEITLTFEALCATALRNAEGEVISGHVSDAEKVTDVWTFARQLGSNDPNWLLVESSRED